MATDILELEEDKLKISVVNMNVNKIVIVVGTTGAGKSTIINMLLNNEFTKEACEEPCKVGSTADSVTKEQTWHFNSRDGKVYGDTIGLGDPGRSNLEIAHGLKEVVQMLNLGVHCIIIVAKFGRFSNEERTNLKIINEIFDSRWVESCIMVLTHYGEETDGESQRTAIQEWLSDDKEITEFVSKIGKRIILTDNSLGRHEAANRPLREQCLKQLNAFVDRCDIPVGPAPTNIIDILKMILELYFGMYRIKTAKQRVKNIVDYLKSESVKTGVCPICLDVMDLGTMAQTGCHHIFHMDCICDAVKKTGYVCPVCRRAVDYLTCVKKPLAKQTCS